MNHLRILLFTFFLAGASAEARLYTEIDRIVQKYHQSEAFHGNIEVRLRNEVIYKKSLGIANEAFDIQNDERSRFMVASLSKQFTAATVLKLAEEGLIDLDTPYSQYVPLKRGVEGNLKAWDSFTIRQLLTHTAGLIRDVMASSFYNPEVYQPNLFGIVHKMTANQNMFYSTRSAEARYSNLGYLLLANLVEEVTGKDFYDILNDKILIPLGLTSTGQYHRMFNIKYMTDGYYYSDGDGELLKRCCRDATSFTGSHGLYSDIDDLMSWLDDITSGASKVLSEESIHQMLTAQVKIQSKDVYYGFGFFIDEINNRQRIWHDGMEYGYLSLVSIIPEIGLKMVILGNRHTADVNMGEHYTKKMNDEISEVVIDSLETLKLSMNTALLPDK